MLQGPNISRPAWARTWHKGSFATLGLLSLHQFGRIIFLENDAVVTRNIDHLAFAPAPSFVNHFDDFDCAIRHVPSDVAATAPLPYHPRWRSQAEVARRVTLMAGLAVLRPSEAEWTRMLALLQATGVGVMPLASGDGSSQTVWRIFYEQYYELPVGYNAFQSAHLAGRLQWSKVHMLHDMSAHRSLVIFGQAGYGRLLQNLTQAAWSMMRRTFGLGLDKYGTMQFLVAQAGRHARADEYCRQSARRCMLGRDHVT